MTKMNWQFIFPTRLTRLPYAVRLTLAMLGMIAGHFVMGFLLADLPPHPPPWMRIVLPNVNPFLWFAYILVFVAIPRFRDSGVHWSAWVLLVIPWVSPLSLIAALFVPSCAFDKKRGAPPSGDVEGECGHEPELRSTTQGRETIR